ncbi:hypothetical protein CEXT_667101 [Caerostris extrusa]|uniref:Uncharacterized protein n=1 Tax=Caerostris extrusa TaxID=172846 RepID=A0AAV4XMX0_CAEEX|nr:hypothetical protein CEXT_667101 [Caerostris extrusa]
MIQSDVSIRVTKRGFANFRLNGEEHCSPRSITPHPPLTTVTVSIFLQIISHPSSPGPANHKGKRKGEEGKKEKKKKTISSHRQSYIMVSESLSSLFRQLHAKSCCWEFFIMLPCPNFSKTEGLDLIGVTILSLGFRAGGD